MLTSPAIASVIDLKEDAPPQRIMLLPAGPDVRTRPHDGRRWRLDNAGKVVEASQALVPLGIDYEHQSIHAPKNGQPAPAAGWITRVYAQDGAIYGEVEWTARATEMLKAREYRYISPVFEHDKQGHITRIIGAGLVFDPALSMPALAGAQLQEYDMDEPKDNHSQDAYQDLRNRLMEALSLDDAADDSALVAAVEALVSGSAEASAKPGDAAAGDAQTDEIKALTARIDRLQTDYQKAQANEAVEKAIAGGKLPPAQRDWALSYAIKDSESFAQFVAAAPVILKAVPPGAPGKPPPALDATEQAICSAMGLSAEQYRAHNPEKEVLHDRTNG